MKSELELGEQRSLEREAKIAAAIRAAGSDFRRLALNIETNHRHPL